MTLDRYLDATSLALATLFLFLFEDLFNNPGIQHVRTAFRG